MDFSIPDHQYIGYLTGEDLRFFYYDVLMEHLGGFPMAYDWDNIVKEFEGKVDISDCHANDIPENVGINTIRFDIRNSSKECKASAFIRHLRNAFAHYRIVREGNNYVLTDQNSRGTLTMRGVINADLLKDFCLRIFSQRDKIIDEYNNAINYR